jgi:hypothetical protein
LKETAEWALSTINRITNMGWGSSSHLDPRCHPWCTLHLRFIANDCLCIKHLVRHALLARFTYVLGGGNEKLAGYC